MLKGITVLIPSIALAANPVGELLLNVITIFRHASEVIGLGEKVPKSGTKRQMTLS